MSAETPRKPGQADMFQSAWYRLLLLVFALYLSAFWFVLGPASPWYAAGVAMGTFSLGPAIAAPIARHAPRRWFRVAAGERPLHRLLGIGLFERLLEASGWNRRVARPMRGFSGRRGGLDALAWGLRANMGAHAACFAIHLALAALALLGRHGLAGALWMLVPGVVLHAYPVLLQRAILLRLQPLLGRIAAGAGGYPFE
ncbi:hypothetical protein [Sphingomonas crusticola]|uniref:glycosyl-4,4'-diaponeurosporenoate acyltransferase CrtO family protein n=1 Tax=Sphingomonas crusticola TaxID=1697973 RepID=UPI0013C2DD9F|nr:hypothetical protein [Sphingomonas crusticola]